MAINLYDVHAAGQRAAAHVEYVSAPEFHKLAGEAKSLGYRHATLAEINASAESVQWAPELFCWRGGLWVKVLETPPFECKYCGVPSWVDPSDQSPPPDYCHPADHNAPE